MTQEAAGPAVTPTCYRHPGRETYVRCTRCDRPICPDCMVAASVGFQCPSCVAEGNAGVRQARTVAGGRIHAREGLVTKTIVVICLTVFVAQLLTGGVNGTVTRALELVGVEVAAGEYYRLLTVVVVHASILHVLLNMYALWVLGPTLEAWLGRLRYASLFVLAGFGGAVASYLFNSPIQPSVGASGAIFGVFGAMLVVARRMHYDVRAMVGLIVINLLLPVFFRGAIDWRAHLGGLAVGLVLGAVFAYPPPRMRVPVAVAGAVAVLAVCCLLTAYRSEQIQQDPKYGPLVEVLRQQAD